MQHDLMPDGHVVPQGQRFVKIGMQHAQVLHIGASPNANRRVIAPNHNAKPDTSIFPQRHITHYLGAVSHPGRVRDLGDFPFKFVNCHFDSIYSDQPEL